ncbi:ATP-binding cassette domain-containing protein [Luteimicrobium sp. DT211]|uniref:ATP-binding cassette domain-containing protein n=1 Tax=Luteimicrobium sp. DT211 TaxID=3393412 RepID=UPI003CF880E8
MRFLAVTQRYDDVDVLAHVDVELAGHVVVRGPNGSGKSTLLRIAAGALEPTAGRVVGRPRHVGYVPERFSPPPGMRADAYLHRTGRLLGLDADAAARRAGVLLERFAVRPRRDARLGDLSKGNRLKVGLAHAFLAPVDLVVLDEPRDGLDDDAAAVLDELVGEAVARGATVLRAAHDDVATGATVLWVGGGRVVVEPAHGDAGAADGDLPFADGEVAALVREPGGTTRTLVLAAGERDAALLDVLRRGGSVLAVRPTAARAPHPADEDAR